MKSCKQCPYRKNSAKGYLGEASFKPLVFLNQLDLPGVHPCHMTVNWEEEQLQLNNKPICIGAIQYMNNSCKLHRNPKVVKLQNLLGKSDEIINNIKEFIEHHSK